MAKNGSFNNSSILSKVTSTKTKKRSAPPIRPNHRSNHALQQLVDFVLTVSVVAALHKVVGLLVEAAHRVAELEGPQEVGDLLEVRANRPDL